MKNYYQTLGVGPSATAEEITTAYIKLSKPVNPGINWDDHIFDELAKNITEAYQVLSDATKRSVYNEKYRHFFFATEQRTAPAEAITSIPTANASATKSLKRKFIINGIICLGLLLIFAVANALRYESEQSVSINKTIESNRIGNKEKLPATVNASNHLILNSGSK